MVGRTDRPDWDDTSQLKKNETNINKSYSKNPSRTVPLKACSLPSFSSYKGQRSLCKSFSRNRWLAGARDEAIARWSKGWLLQFCAVLHLERSHWHQQFIQHETAIASIFLSLLTTVYSYGDGLIVVKKADWSWWKRRRWRWLKLTFQL